MQSRRKLIMCMVCLLCGVSLVACDKKEDVDPAKVVYEYGDSTITYGEFYIYARTVE